MRILLINPPIHFRNPSYRRVPDVVHVGLLYVGRALLDAGHRVSCLDIFAENLSAEQVRGRLQSLKGSVDLIGITAMSVQYAYIKWLASIIKKEMGDIPIVLGGALAIFSPKTVLAHTAVDMAVTGEGERTMVELLDAGGGKGVRGVAYRDNGDIRVNPPAELIRDIDAIGYPAYELMPMEIYQRGMGFRMPIAWPDGSTRDTQISYFCVSGGRGCPFKCNFCSRCLPGMRLRSVDAVIAEIKHFRKVYDFNGILFMDELALANRRRAEEMADKMGPLGLHWTGNGRVNYFDKELFLRLRAGGCYQVIFGIESGSQKILDAMNKRQSREKARTVLLEALDAGIRPNIQMIFGYPGEDDATIEETRAFFDGLPLSVGLAILTPLPGSTLYDQCLREGRIKSEDAYLDGLEGGFHSLHLNLTDWDDEEFLRKRAKLAETISREAAIRKMGWLNYYLQQPIEYFMPNALPRAIQALKRTPLGAVLKRLKAMGFSTMKKPLQ